MTINLQRTLRALHWQANARSQPATPQVDQNALYRARSLHLAGDLTGAIECLQADPNWEHDPRAWRVIGLSSQALARYEKDPERRQELYQVSEKAAATDRSRRVTETAEADVNLAATLIDQRRYPEALEVALRASATDPRLPTARIAILAIYLRQKQHEAVLKYLKHLMEYEAWIFDDAVFLDHIATDPDVDGVSDFISSLKRSP
jgi:tetratricopeptide (TPR) repeat protein